MGSRLGDWGERTATQRFARHTYAACPDCGAPECNGSCAEQMAEAAAQRSADAVQAREPRTRTPEYDPMESGLAADPYWRDLMEGEL